LSRNGFSMILALLLSAAIAFVPFGLVAGQTSDQAIQITSTRNSAWVGEPVHIVSNLLTSNGQYRVFLGDNLVASGTATGIDVAADFLVPEMPYGDYNITLVDVTAGENGTTPFRVIINWYINPILSSSIAQIQEGNAVVLNLTLTGGLPSTVYHPDIMVTLPDPSATNLTGITSFTTSAVGTARGSVSFPDTALFGSGANTLLAGTYTAYYNKTDFGPSTTFSVGLTGVTQYHRLETVGIRAVGYKAGETATVIVKNNSTGATLSSASVTASSSGVFSSSWVVPANAQIGNYLITVNAQNTHKAVPDQQYILIPGYSILIQTRNLAGALVPQIQVQAIDQAVNAKYMNTTGSDGQITMKLETGSVVFSVFWNNVSVGDLTQSISGNTTITIVCRLATLKVDVQNKDGVPISFVNLNIDFQYVTANGTVQKSKYSGQTDALGTFNINSTLPGIDYTVSASLYGTVFSSNTVNLPPVASYIATILCPSETLSVTIVDYGDTALQNMRLELVEQNSGIFYSSQTGSSGTVTLSVTFGQYDVRVYKGNVLLNETVINVFGDKLSKIHCDTYNLQVSVKVIDYFGNSIPNVNVVLSGTDYGTMTKQTQTNGVATFTDVTGGNMQITAYSPGRTDSYVTNSISVVSPGTIPIKMNDYVSLGPFLLETTLFTTLMLILCSIIIFLAVELYHRKTLRARTA